jgi:hypothetical protein
VRDRHDLTGFNGLTVFLMAASIFSIDYRCRLFPKPRTEHRDSSCLFGHDRSLNLEFGFLRSP